MHLARYADTRVLKLGNVDAVRDWGHAKDFAKAFHLIMTEAPNTDPVYVVSTG